MPAFFRLSCAIALLAAATDPGWSATKKELTERYGINPGVERVSGDISRVIRAHDADPRLKKFDIDNDGRFNDAEMAAASREDEEKYSAPPWEHDRSKSSSADRFEAAGETVQAKLGVPVIYLETKAPNAPVSDCEDDQRFFIRRDKLDNYMFNLAPLSKAQGASVAYTKDWDGSSYQLKMDGNVSLALWREPCRDRPEGVSGPYLSAYAFAPWIGAHGTRSDGPGGTSDLRFGIEAQAELFNPRPFNSMYFSLSPYYQTDFRGDGNAYGIEASWTPYWLEARLGGNVRRLSPYLDWYWQFAAEADYLNVQSPGRTDLEDKDYAWLGFTTKLHVFPLAGSEIGPEFLQDRFHLTGTAKYHWDAISGEVAALYSAEAAYNLDESGATSLSLLYENGKRKETLEEVDQMQLRLNYKY
ncbi:hypothetical protein NKH41_27530 [Mesorhizobium sp. M1169]|uniref:hypothetical protein n=1 Tax=Mesorhizobium sp. M1169 TaxID=2957066 RepID=UPI00333D087C